MDKMLALKCNLHYCNSVFKINITRGLEMHLLKNVSFATKQSKKIK